MKRNYFLAAALSAAMALTSVSAMSVFADETDAASVVITYDNLGTLLSTGNATVKKALEDNQSDIQTYTDMRDILEWQEKNNAEQAASLRAAIKQVNKRLDTLTGTQTERGLNQTVTAYTLTAQTLMNSYNQQLANVTVASKDVETASANYQAAITKQSIGSMTATDVLSAQKNLTQAQNTLTSRQQTAETTKQQLLTLLGISSNHVTIGTIPEPDLTAIDAIDYEADKNKAIGNYSSVQSARHSNASTSGARDRRNSSVAEAEGTAEADFLSIYQDVLVQKTNYEAASSAFAAAQQTYNGLQLKKQAGMITNADYLSGEAAYLTKKAARDAAAMNLVEAYETYKWKVEGVSAS